MTEQQKRKIGICDTTLRDSQQSLLATRLKIDDILEVAPYLDKIGFAACEVWGGATFDTCIRFLDEDPWERLRKIRKAMPNTKLQMLLRGQNLLGYRHYPDDVVEEFVKHSVADGIDIIRIFDALNDLRNIEKSIKATKEAGASAQPAFSYTVSPIHNVEYYVKLAKEMEDMGADSIALKDMSGILSPTVAYELSKAIKEAIHIPLQIHSHHSTGMAPVAYYEAIRAGADIIDCAMSSMALSSSQPAVDAMVACFLDSPYETGIKLNDLDTPNALLKEIRKKYAKFDKADPRVNVAVLKNQIPGGMISNFISQLRDMNASDRLPEVLEEVPKVRADMGYPPLVTPMSQMVGSQAVLNVLSGERYKMKTKEITAYLKGAYGKSPGPIDEDFRKSLIGDEEVITCRPADLMEPQMESAQKEIGAWAEGEEDVLTYLLFPEQGKTFLKHKTEKRMGVDPSLLDEQNKTYPV
ncbi:MAG: pyruvate carboxylase subunit B [Firmicutes bacterium]|nr:pyruvate carboxylase subunit B [Bacillota bacterium]